LSSTAKALMAFHEKHVGASVGGAVWMPEEVYEKLIELARREVRPKAAAPVPMPGAEGSR
jgi:hypothetical protein